LRLTRIEARLAGAAARIARHAARRHVVTGAIAVPVSRPLPDVARHVVEPVAVRREASDRRSAHPAIQLAVPPGELALPRIGARRTTGWSGRSALALPGPGG